MLTPCTVKTAIGGNVWIVRFPAKPGYELFMQSDWEQHAFASACGKCDGDKTPADESFIELDPETIMECPDDYLDTATPITE